MSYWDASALVKLYLPEADSPFFEKHAATAPAPLVTSRLSFYELRTVFERKEVEGIIRAGTAESLYQRLLDDTANGFLRVVEFSPILAKEFENAIIGCFTLARPIFIRTLDGIHLASAISEGETELVATDKRLREAAAAFHLRVAP